MTPSILKKMFVHLNMSNVKDRALWCSFLISFYGLLRKSNAVPRNATFDVKKVLVRRNIRVDNTNNMVYVYLGYGKTNNFCTRDVLIPIPGNNDSALDPVRHIRALYSSVSADPDKPAFSFSKDKFVNFRGV